MKVVLYLLLIISSIDIFELSHAYDSSINYNNVSSTTPNYYYSQTTFQQPPNSEPSINLLTVKQDKYILSIIGTSKISIKRLSMQWTDPEGYNHAYHYDATSNKLPSPPPTIQGVGYGYVPPGQSEDKTTTNVTGGCLNSLICGK